MTNYGLAIDLFMVDQVSEDPLLDRKDFVVKSKRNSFVRIGKYLCIIEQLSKECMIKY